MFELNPIARGIALAFSGTVAVAALTGTANAQTTELERAVITGTRIISEGAESASPLQQINSKAIEESGVINLQNVLVQNPAIGTPTLTRNNSNFLTSGSGVATVNLRNLGDDRTLVLVNGRRYVSGTPTTFAVDLNTIPTAFIDRVDILTGGQSALYGSDAVAGVVNIITKRDFNGLAVDAQYGKSFEGDDDQQSGSLTFGTSGQRGFMMGHVGFSKQGAVYSRDRDFVDTDQIDRSLLTGDPADMFIVQRPFFSSFAPQGRVFFGGGNRTFDAAGNLIPFSTNGADVDGDGFADGPGATGFDRNKKRTITVPADRYLFAGTGEYEWSKGHSAYFEGNYANTKTVSDLEPFPMDSAQLFPGTGGIIPAQFMVNGVLVNNPMIRPDILALLTDRDGDGAVDYNFTRRLSEVGNRGQEADRHTYRILAGLKGNIMGPWNYDAFVSHGVTTESQVGGGQVNVLNFRNALRAIPDGAGGAVCLDPDAVAEGCVPVNVFGFNSISPEAARYINAPTTFTSETRQNVAGVTVTGEVTQLPAGPLGVAGGIEYRKEFSRATHDALGQLGLNASNAIPETKGGFDVWDYFLEGRFPIVKDQPYAKMLAATAAVRYGDYSTVGGTFSYSLGLEWGLNNDLRFRATGSQATRAPNILELFQGPTQDFPTGLQDPCDGVTATTGGTLGTRCLAAPGVAANVAANGAFTLNQADIQGISGFDRGNPNLEEEEGKSWTLGLVFTPRNINWLRNTAFTIDYFDIKIDDAIVQTPRQFILDQCYTGDTSFCSFITRRPTPEGSNSAGSIEFVDAAVSNSGGLRAKGIDFTAAWADRVGPGQLDARFSWTHYLEGYVIPLPGASKDYFVGEVAADPTASPGDQPENKWTLSLGYTWGPWGVSMRNTYIGEMALDDQFLNSFDLARGSKTIDAEIYTDIQGTYQIHKNWSLYAGIDNLFGTEQSKLLASLPGGITGVDMAVSHDPIGRRYYLGVRGRL
jgi:outer membrane receptor protein involved in Fe transport